MTTTFSREAGTVTPTEQESHIARESGRQLAPYLGTEHALRFQVVEDDKQGEIVSIPVPALRLLVNILTEMAEGNAIAVIPTHCELTTQQAAELLNVSRPFLIGLLEEGKIPYHRVGTHRRVLYRDLMTFKTEIDAARRRSLDELAALSQELGMGY